MMAITLPFAHKIGFNSSLLLGYTTIVLSLLLVYFGVRSYRDNVNSGQITFGKAFAVGICITLISCLCYVVAWEVIYFNFLPNFMEEYGAHALERAKVAGASDATLLKQAEELKKSKEMYNNVFYNAALTFTEPFPVGLVITLLSAALLRRKPKAQTAQTPVPAS
jgi:hypothetical protein